MALLRSLKHDKPSLRVSSHSCSRRRSGLQALGRLCSSVAVVSHSDGTPQKRVLDALRGIIPATGMLSRAPDIG